MTDRNEQDYMRSSHCGTGACVEVRAGAERAYIRDSASLAELCVATASFLAFIEAVKSGEFDAPVTDRA